MEQPPRSRRRLATHWAILVGLVLGIMAGALLQTLEAEPTLGLKVSGDPGRFPDPPAGVRVTSVAADSPAARAGIRRDDFLLSLTRDRGKASERRVSLDAETSLRQVVAELEVGEVVWLTLYRYFEGSRREVTVTAGLAADCPRAELLSPFSFVADIFLSLLKMLIVPIVLASIVTGVAGLKGSGDLGRLSLRTFAYYISTSLLAILVGLFLVQIISPGVGAELGLTPGKAEEFADLPSLWEIFRRIVPPNVFQSFSDNGAMLQIIFFALLLGFVITRLPEPHGRTLSGFFEAFFQAMMSVARLVLALIPLGVLALVARVVGETGFSVFGPLFLYMLTVVAGLLLHAFVVLPTILFVMARVRPWRHAQAVSPALLTAFFTSSSSVTLPVTLKAVQERAGVSKKVTSFVCPLGATINMDGTALYECVGVLFLAQAYSSLPGSDFTLTLGGQAMVVLTALLASIGAAGIPSAGLVMMLTILSALGLPLEGAALLLAVDRPLDMMRTTVNVWSDTCAAAVVARLEGEVVASARPRAP